MRSSWLHLVSVSLFGLFACAADVASRARADVVVTFEDLTVPAAGFSNGNPGTLSPGQSVTGTWTSEGVSFANRFGIDGFFGYESWAGFSYSNIAAPGPATYTNQYASYPGGGFHSATYAVAYQDTFTPFVPAITLPVATAVSGFRIANTTYAYGVMTEVDPYGFSVPLAAGTGWFATTATGFQGGVVTGSATFFLADLRSASLVGVRAGWEWFDLGPLGVVDRIEFTFDGSDQGAYGLNTPTYFAMDDLTIATVPEPGSWALLGGGVVAWGIFRHRRRGVRS